MRSEVNKLNKSYQTNFILFYDFALWTRVGGGGEGVPQSLIPFIMLSSRTYLGGMSGWVPGRLWSGRAGGGEYLCPRGLPHAFGLRGNLSCEQDRALEAFCGEEQAGSSPHPEYQGGDPVSSSWLGEVIEPSARSFRIGPPCKARFDKFA